MEVERIPVRLCRLCGRPFDSTSYGDVCSECSADQSDLHEPFHTATGEEEVRPLDPDSPRWGVGLAFATWGVNIALSLFIPLLAVVIWLVFHMAGSAPPDSESLRALLESPTSILIQVISIVPVHLLTIGFCWGVVTGMGKRPFLQSLGWQWTPSDALRKVAPLITRAIGLMIILVVALVAIALMRRHFSTEENAETPRMFTITVAAAAAVVAASFLILLSRLERKSNPKAALALAKGSYMVGVLILVMAASSVLERILPQRADTAFDLLVRSSPQVRIWLALLAVFTAPFVEEVVYRGVLFSALRPRMGMNWAVAIATLVFAGIHFPQYWGNWAGMAGITLLSLSLTAVRASTGSIFPCVAIHFLNNIAGAIQILAYKGS